MRLRQLQQQIDAEAIAAAQRLQFEAEDRQRRIDREDAEHVARLVSMNSGQQNNAAATINTDGELPQSTEERFFCTLFPTVPPKQLLRVYKWPNPEYDPSEIYKLCIDSGFDEPDDTYESKMTATGLVYTKRRGRKEDYPKPQTWSNAFLLWMTIRIVHSKDVNLLVKLHRFHHRIMRLAATYTWEGVLKLAIAHHTTFYNDPDASWMISSEEVDLRCTKLSQPNPPRGPSTPRTPRVLGTEICKKWNQGLCEATPCRWGHIHDACNHLGCNEKHQAHLYHQKQGRQGSGRS